MTKPPRTPSQPLLGDADAPLRSRPRKKRNPAQHQLTLDPMPARIDPCLALLKPRPPKGRQWAFEVKWDGYRLAVNIESKGVRILTNGGHDWTERFPAIVAQAKRLPVSTAILDGEAVVFDELGRSDFGKLQQSLGGRGGKRTSWESVLMVFDLLYLDGHDLTGTELTARRHLLEGIVRAGGEEAIRLSEEIEADGETLLRIASSMGLKASSRKIGTVRIAAGAVANGRRSNASRATASRSSAIKGPARRSGISARCCWLRGERTSWSTSDRSVLALRQTRHWSFALRWTSLRCRSLR
ncbi:hypothetical protein GGE45_001470 [Rhizobium aethiopicum]|uniref:ATP-dependent DNA ligase family profile domain-containing protein n=1 Tax=Rhizobium aethiopicum TaxID=1138170 RepID=A0A7W6MFJ8_9HYPH|nr:hypothetical protein [Rhizobium aethiopicum]MBB4579150.1 hypothetical protein [Rhizobium aethiopicum]